MRQFTPDSAQRDPDPVLPPACIVGAVSWQVEEHVREAQRSVTDPGRAPPNTLFVPKAVHSEVLQSLLEVSMPPPPYIYFVSGSGCPP